MAESLRGLACSRCVAGLRQPKLRHASRVGSEPGYSVDVVDDTFIVAAPEVVSAEVHRAEAWARWWPDLSPTVTRDRGVKGVQWAVTGALAGSMEIWLEPWGDGVVLHWYLRAHRPEAPGGIRRRRPAAAGTDGRVRAWKRHAFALKDRLEAGREPGSARASERDAAAGVKGASVPAESS